MSKAECIAEECQRFLELSQRVDVVERLLIDMCERLYAHGGSK